MNHAEIYAMLEAEAARAGLPITYTRDLTYHDLRAIESREAGEPFLWALYDAGTHLYFARRNGERSYRCEMMPAIISRAWPGAAFYVFDGSKLVTCRDNAEAADMIRAIPGND